MMITIKGKSYNTEAIAKGIIEEYPKMRTNPDYIAWQDSLISKTGDKEERIERLKGYMAKAIKENQDIISAIGMNEYAKKRRRYIAAIEFMAAYDLA